MSNALYPGLGNTADRPLTADSWKSHRGNPFAKAGSTHTRSRRSSRRHSQTRPVITSDERSSEDSGNGTDHLHDLLRRSQDALGALAKPSTEDVTGQPGPSYQNERRNRNSALTFGSTDGSAHWQDPLWKTLSRQSSVLAASTKDTSNDHTADPAAENQESSNPTSDVQLAPSEPDIADSAAGSTYEPDGVKKKHEAVNSSLDDGQAMTSAPGTSSGDEASDQFSATLVKTNTWLSRSVSSSAGGRISGLDSQDGCHTDPASVPRSQSPQDGKVQALCRQSLTMAITTTAPTDEASDDDSHDGLHSLYDEKLEEALASDEKTKRQEKVVKFDKVDEKTIETSSVEGDPEKFKVDHSTTATPEAPGMYGLPLFALTSALSMAVFLVAMDVNVIATAVPHITGEFRSLEDVGWYGSAFLMTTCGFQVLFGRIYTIFPAKWVFVSAILVFLAGSLVAALASSSTIFIVGRAIQGMGTSGILSGGLIIIAQVVPLRMRSFIGGAIGAMEGVAMISAPVLGGVLTDKLSWRWCFYINLPIGGFVLIVVFLFLRIPEANRPQAAKKASFLQTLYQLDVIGATLLMPPIICLLLALQEGGTLRRPTLKRRLRMH